MTKLHHFHPARKGSGSLRPFPIYPLYTQTVILSLDKPIADCFLFRPRKSREKRRKRSHTNVSSTLSTRSSTPPAQTPQRSFQGAAAGTHATPAPNRAHSGLHAETGAFRTEGAITTLGAFRTFTNIPGPGVKTANFAGSGVLIWCTPEERREPAGQRCAHARRCSEASRPRRAA